MKQLHLAYSHQNKALADTIEAAINDVTCVHHTDLLGQPDGAFANELQETEGPVVLLITDNFIKSEQCMSGALPMLLALMRQNRILPIVADGVVEKDDVRNERHECAERVTRNVHRLVVQAQHRAHTVPPRIVQTIESLNVRHLLPTHT